MTVERDKGKLGKIKIGFKKSHSKSMEERVDECVCVCARTSERGFECNERVCEREKAYEWVCERERENKHV